MHLGGEIEAQAALARVFAHRAVKSRILSRALKTRTYALVSKREIFRKPVLIGFSAEEFRRSSRRSALGKLGGGIQVRVGRALNSGK